MSDPRPVGGQPRVSAVVLVYGEEPWLERCVKTLLASVEADVEVVLVDNGCTDGSVERLEAAGLQGLRIVRPGANLGFAAGNNEGARHADGDVIALVNGDAIAEPTALARLAEVALRPDVGIATASVRLADTPELLNSGGNDIHFLGVSWAGRFRQPADQWPAQHDVSSASGAGMAVRKELWDELGGFDEHYFIYHDDTEMSLRCWQRGLRVVYVPEAVIAHNYEFSKNPRKFYLLERNRLITVSTLYGGRTLALLAPTLIVFELAMLVLAIREGWARQKVAGWGWLLKHLTWLRTRRAALQAERTVADRDLTHLFVDRLDPGNYPVSSALRPFDAMLASYWRIVRRFV
jgi:GT2 family glycosyltransferase